VQASSLSKAACSYLLSLHLFLAALKVAACSSCECIELTLVPLSSSQRVTSCLRVAATCREGAVLPWELIEERLRATHPYSVFTVRSMLSVPYFEKRLYELPEEEVGTPN